MRLFNKISNAIKLDLQREDEKVKMLSESIMAIEDSLYENENEQEDNIEEDIDLKECKKIESELHEKIDDSVDNLERNKDPIKNILSFLYYLVSDDNDKYLVWIRKSEDYNDDSEWYQTKIYFCNNSFFYKKISKYDDSEINQFSKNYIILDRTYYNKKDKAEYFISSSYLNDVDINNSYGVKIESPWVKINSGIYKKTLDVIKKSNVLNKQNLYTIFDKEADFDIECYEKYQYLNDNYFKNDNYVNEILDYKSYSKIEN